MTPRTRQRRRQSSLPGGFTLVELLVVIVIITLLMGILVPTVQSVIKTMNQTKAKARLESLSRSVDLWYKVNNNHYPGQVNANWRDDPDTSNGSELLARALFTKTDDDGDDIFPASTQYADFSGGILFDYEVDETTHENVLSDGLPTPMPILYYPSRLGEGNFRASDNGELVTDETKGGNFGGGSGPYLLLSAGADRLYFTSDDITNGNAGG